MLSRGPVVRVDSAGPSTGNILLSPDKRRLVWDIGQYIKLYINLCCYIVGIFPQQGALSLVTSRSHDI